MVETIVPGTYITVRSEGLISAGRVATGIVGVVGTAASGPVDTPVTLSGFANAREVFGNPDAFKKPEFPEKPLTLVRALEQIYNNGASSVIAVRVAGGTAESAEYVVRDGEGNATVTLEAKTPGSWGNDIQIKVAKAEADGWIEEEIPGPGESLTYKPVVEPKVPQARVAQIRVYRAASKGTQSLKVIYQEEVAEPELQMGQVAIKLADGSLTFAAGEELGEGDRNF